MANLIDGKAIAKQIRGEIKAAVAAFMAKTGHQPGLATVLVGDDPASAYYVRSKHKQCVRAGMNAVSVKLSAEITQPELDTVIQQLNADDAVDGILVQFPLPDHLDQNRVIDLIDPSKDVDGFNPLNVGQLAMRGRRPDFVACTPAGCMRLLEETGVELRGARAVVVGRSNLVGTPLALLLTNADATVTLCHSHTKDLAAIVRQADVLIVAIGKPHFITGDMIKSGAVVIDVGINQIDAADDPRGYRLVGDVDFDSAEKIAAAITPVPGGVGPMTIAMLLSNTLKSAQKRHRLKSTAKNIKPAQTG